MDASRLKGIIFPTKGSPLSPSTTIESDDMLYTLGNQVLTGDVNVYHIYYGNVSVCWILRKFMLGPYDRQWSASQKDILEHFNNNIGSSKWYDMNRRKLIFQL
jgi:hypothetical protein